VLSHSEEMLVLFKKKINKKSPRGLYIFSAGIFPMACRKTAVFFLFLFKQQTILQHCPNNIEMTNNL